MINVHGVVTWSGASAPRFARLGGRHRFETPVRSIERSVRFYRRVFGFHATVDSEVESATIALAPQVELVLDAGAVQRCSVEPRWGLLVTDINAVRAAAWDLDVKVARDSGAPDQIYREANIWSLYVQDPDGNLIQLVEARAGRAAPSSRLSWRGAADGPGRWTHHDDRRETAMHHGGLE